MPRINKSALVMALGGDLRIMYSDAEKFLNALVERIYSELKAGNSVSISGFGQFSVSHRAPRRGVNPRNPSEKITIPELNTPKFLAGSAFKEAIKLNK